jgi:hypothetical protein
MEGRMRDKDRAHWSKVLVCAGLILSAPVRSFADGVFVWRNEHSDIREPEQKALVLFDRGLEDLVLEVRYEGAVSDFGWIVPLPSRPRMRPDDPKIFEELNRSTQDFRAPRSPRSSRMAATAGMSRELGVIELARARVGVYDAAVLQGSDGKSLERWLAANDFRLPKGGADVFDEYARRGWVFVALRIAPERADSTTQKALADGTLQPIRFRFETPEPVFPLRVSALGGATDVLLYTLSPSPLVRRGGGRGTWNVGVYGPWHPFGLADPIGDFPRTEGQRLFLSKMRARLEPAEMEDVAFDRYDPIAGLRSDGDPTRLMAIAHLGWLTPAGAAAELTKVVHSSDATESERVSALWSLGQIGGPEAIMVLESAVERGSWPERIEALESLARVDPGRAVEHCYGGLRFNEEDGARSPESAFAEACLDHLVAHGDARCLPRLRELEAKLPPPRTPSPYGFPSGPSAAERLLALRAACGDESAQAAIVARLAEGAADTEPGTFMAHAQHPGSFINDYPGAMWPGAYLIHSMPPFHLGSWRQSLEWHRALEVRPETHDAVFRSAAHRAEMPPIGRALLLGTLLRPGAADVSELLEIARDGRGPDAAVLSTPAATHAAPGTSPDPDSVVRFEVQTCTAAYALGKLRAGKELLQLWKEHSKADRHVRGELAFAMTLADTALVLPALVDYVRREWNARAGTADFVEDLKAANRRITARGITDFSLRVIDVPYRIAIARQITRHGGPETLLSLMEDTTLEPWFRLYWSWSLQHFREEERVLRPRVVAALADIERRGAADPDLAQALASARQSIAIGDKVYAEHVAPRKTPAWSD